MSDIFQMIFQRRSIRKFTREAVEPDRITQLLQAAMAAPSAVNSKPWEFVVVTEPETLASLRRRLLFGRYEAPLAIVVLGNPRIANNPAGRTYWVQDCSAATQNLLLAASGAGLGAVWIGIYPQQAAMKTVRDLLNIPADILPLSMVYAGHPAETKPARTQYEERRVHWQVYEPRKPGVKSWLARLFG